MVHDTKVHPRSYQALMRASDISELNNRILSRSRGDGGIIKLYQDFHIQQRFAVSYRAFRQYVRELERISRDGWIEAVERQVLPDRKEPSVRLVAARAIARALREAHISPAEVAALCRTAINLCNLDPKTPPTPQASPDDQPDMDRDTMADAVRDVYGVTMPTPAENDPDPEPSEEELTPKSATS